MTESVPTADFDGDGVPFFRPRPLSSVLTMP